MARVIVTPDEETDVVLLDENVYPVHLENKLSSLQVIERLAWAVDEAEARGGPRPHPRTNTTARRRRTANASTKTSTTNSRAARTISSRATIALWPAVHQGRAP